MADELNSDETASDLDLVARFRAGDARAFEVLLGRYEAPLLGFAARFGGWRQGRDDHRAQDLVQGVFLRFLKEARSATSAFSPDAATPVASLSAWLFRVARNLTIDQARKEERMERRELMAASPETATSPPPSVETEEICALVETKLRDLPERQREVIVLKIHGEKTYREIAEITGLSISNVGYLIHRGVKSLASELRSAGVV